MIVGGGSTEAEVINLNGKTFSLRDIPSRRDGAVGGILGSTPILCGGYYRMEYDSCLSLKSSQWTETHKLTKSRTQSASVQLNPTTLWILGGHSDGYSTEFVGSRFKNLNR